MYIYIFIFNSNITVASYTINLCHILIPHVAFLYSLPRESDRTSAKTSSGFQLKE